jgi:hypothetical protein
MIETRTRWETHYASGNTPWDTQITPPEVQAFWSSGHLAPMGLALDIGCGPGTNVRYLAHLGLTTVGFDIAYQAVAPAHLRPRAPFSATRNLVRADVTLPFSQARPTSASAAPRPPTRPAPRYRTSTCARRYHLYAFDYVPRPEEERTPDGHADNVLAAPPPSKSLTSPGSPDRYPCRWYSSANHSVGRPPTVQPLNPSLYPAGAPCVTQLISTPIAVRKSYYRVRYPLMV